MFEKGRIVAVDAQVGVVVLTGSELGADMDDHTGVWFGTFHDGQPEVMTIPTEYLVAGPPPLVKH